MTGRIAVEELVVILAVAILVVIPVARICRRAGYSPWLAAWVLLPVANLALLYFLAFARWPALSNMAQNTTGRDE